MLLWLQNLPEVKLIISLSISSPLPPSPEKAKWPRGETLIKLVLNISTNAGMKEKSEELKLS